MIRKYFDVYRAYNSSKWFWKLQETEENRKKYLEFRARKAPDEDILPDFSSIEKDANNFNLGNVTFTDIFGIEWSGHKGGFQIHGAPDYEQHLYYDIDENTDFDSEIGISETYTRKDPPPGHTIFKNTAIPGESFKDYIFIKDIITAEYHYIVDNHLFKDTNITLYFEGGEQINIYTEENYRILLKALIQMKRTDIIKPLMKTINEHFNKLANDKETTIQSQYPGMSAEKYFKVDY